MYSYQVLRNTVHIRLQMADGVDGHLRQQNKPRCKNNSSGPFHGAILHGTLTPRRKFASTRIESSKLGRCGATVSVYGLRAVLSLQRLQPVEQPVVVGPHHTF